uniref:Uncharacterized protein n=1 Tax=Panagrolaimus davidi TaxID=227884 RepID=A0A914QU16_9BILA
MKFPNFSEFRFSCFRQYFSIPEPIIFYAAKNPTSMKLYQKLIESCKYFFIKNPILNFHSLKICGNEWKVCKYNCYDCRWAETFCLNDIEKIQSKISVQYTLKIVSRTSPNCASSMISKMKECNPVNLKLSYQNISFNEFLVFSKTLQACILYETKIIYENGKEVPCENLISNLPKAFHFDLTLREDSFSDFSNTANELLKIPHFKNLYSLNLSGISGDFDIDTFFDYLKENKTTRMFLEFNHWTSSEYENKLQMIADEIIDDFNPETYKPPYIEFCGQISRTQLYNLYKKYYYL